MILPLTVLRRLDCVLEPTKQKVIDYLPKIRGLSPATVEEVLKRKAKLSFCNRSKFDFQKLTADPNDIGVNLKNYINGFSKNARTILERFNFNDHIKRLDKANLLYKVIKRFAEVDLHPDKIRNIEMGYIFEELIREFAGIRQISAEFRKKRKNFKQLMYNNFITINKILKMTAVRLVVY